MDLSVIIPTHSRPDLLARLLASLRDAKRCGFKWEVLVVENAAPPELRPAFRSVVASSSVPIRHLIEPTPGKCRALNLGIREASGDTVAFLDDDVIVHQEYLIGIEEALAASSHRVFGGRVFPVWPYPPPRWVTGGRPLETSRGPIVVHDYGDEPLPYTGSMRRPVGCNFFCRRELFARHVYFDVRLGPGAGKGHMGGEESKLLKRFQQGGETILYAPRVAVDHPVEPERMTKAYFRYRLFCSGRSAPYLAKQTFHTVLGIPRHLFARLALSAGQSAVALATGRSLAAFDHQLDVCRFLGAIYEYHRLWRGLRSRRAAAPGGRPERD